MEAELAGGVLNLSDSTAEGTVELISATVDGVSLKMASKSESFTLKIWHFQVDDLRPTSPYPIIVQTTCWMCRYRLLDTLQALHIRLLYHVALHKSAVSSFRVTRCVTHMVTVALMKSYGSVMSTAIATTANLNASMRNCTVSTILVWDSISWAVAGEKRVSDKVLADLHELLRVPKSGGLASVDGDVFFHMFGALPPTMKVDFHLGRKRCTVCCAALDVNITSSVLQHGVAQTSSQYTAQHEQCSVTANRCCCTCCGYICYTCIHQQLLNFVPHTRQGGNSMRSSSGAFLHMLAPHAVHRPTHHRDARR
eukprot:6050-Heterococcus_DN1.PRE.3